MKFIYTSVLIKCRLSSTAT